MCARQILHAKKLKLPTKLILAIIHFPSRGRRFPIKTLVSFCRFQTYVNAQIDYVYIVENMRKREAWGANPLVCCSGSQGQGIKILFSGTTIKDGEEFPGVLNEILTRQQCRLHIPATVQMGRRGRILPLQ